MIGGLIVIFGFILIVMIHEGGHLLAAKMFNIKATKYFLGFGPTIWSFTKGETEYGIKAIPAGGFVKILGMNPMEEVAEEGGHVVPHSVSWRVAVEGLRQHPGPDNPLPW